MKREAGGIELPLLESTWAELELQLAKLESDVRRLAATRKHLNEGLEPFSAAVPGSQAASSDDGAVTYAYEPLRGNDVRDIHGMGRVEDRFLSTETILNRLCTKFPRVDFRANR